MRSVCQVRRQTREMAGGGGLDPVCSKHFHTSHLVSAARLLNIEDSFCTVVLDLQMWSENWQWFV